jgi:hypothetical protein
MTLRASGVSTDWMAAKSDFHGDAVSGFAIRSKVNFTSALVSV